MKSKLTANYKSRFPYYSEHPLNHPKNAGYVCSLAKWALNRIKSSAKPYSDKHKGVKDNGKPGKVISITARDLEEIIIKSNAISPDGVSIHLASLSVLNQPGTAMKLNMLTSEQRNRFPSIDRIDSSKGYVKGNIQLTTKNYNLGKSNNTILSNQQIEKNTLVFNYNGLENITITEVSASFVNDLLRKLTA
jgi:hypothetical protein